MGAVQTTEAGLPVYVNPDTGERYTDAIAVVAPHLRGAALHHAGNLVAGAVADLVYQGRLVEEGTHAELLARGGLYARYWNRQSGGFIGTEEAAE